MQITLTRQLHQHSLKALVIQLVFCTLTMAQPDKPLVRLAIIKVDSMQVDSYNEFLREEIEASIRLEPGVITLYAVAEKENPEHVTLFETYLDSAGYKSHLATPHFQKYKQGTLHMVKDLQLIETKPILYVRKKELSKTKAEHLFIRLIKIEIDSARIQDFTQLAATVMLPGIAKEKGVLVMYAVAEKLKPTKVTVLEVYCGADAYKSHIKTPHFIKYKSDSKNMIRSPKLIDVKPILLGSKPQEY